MPTLSIIVPCYNEEQTLRACVDRILRIAEPGLELELILVDDCSRDASMGIALELACELKEVRVLHHEVNQGKGAALRTGFKAATGDYVAVQDADLEYDPQELKKLIVPLVEGDADVVVGSRFLSGGSHRVLYFWHSMGNKFLTLLSNMFTNLNLTDMETCYKVFRREVIQGIEIEENRFGFEPEIIAKVAAGHLRIFEMGISYNGRTYEDGKKIGWRDGLRAIYCILHYNAPNPDPTVQMLYQGFVAVAAWASFVLFDNLDDRAFYLADARLLAPLATALLLSAAMGPCLSKSWRPRLTLAILLLLTAVAAYCVGGVRMAWRDDARTPWGEIATLAIGSMQSWGFARSALKKTARV